MDERYEEQGGMEEKEQPKYPKFIEFQCRFCDYDIGSITRSGPHLKCCCAKCGRYQKFIGKNDIGNYKQVGNETL